MDKLLKLESEYFANKSIKAEEKKLKTYQPLHWHDFYEIEYIIDGEGEYIINGNSNQIKSGALFFSTPTDIHEIKFKKETHIINLSFTSHYIDDKLITPTLSSFVTNDTNNFYQFILQNIVKAAEESMNNKTLYIKSLITAILIKIIERGNNVDINQSHIASHKNLRNIIFYINKHFSESLDLETLSKIANLTPKYLSKRFIEMSGVTISQYILDIRLNYAKNLVVTTDIPVKQICFKSGFNAVSHFSRCFKSKFGLSPNTMRNMSSKIIN